MSGGGQKTAPYAQLQLEPESAAGAAAAAAARMRMIRLRRWKQEQLCMVTNAAAANI